MREALAISAEEGLKEQWQRHEAMHHMLWDGLKSMGLKSFVENDSERLITVNTIKVTSPHVLEKLLCLCSSFPRPLCCIELYSSCLQRHMLLSHQQISMSWGWKQEAGDSCSHMMSTQVKQHGTGLWQSVCQHVTHERATNHNRGKHNEDR